MATKTTTAKKSPANSTKKKKNNNKPVTGALTSVADSTKDLLDDVLKTAGDLEKKARKQAKHVAAAARTSAEGVNERLHQVAS